MSTQFDHLLIVDADTVQRELRLAAYLARAEKLRDIAQECAADCVAAMEAAAAYDRLAEATAACVRE